MKRIFIGTMVVLFISCGVSPQKLSKPYLSKWRTTINLMAKEIRTADLNTISINGNIKWNEITIEEEQEIMRAMLNGEKEEDKPNLIIEDINHLPTEEERKQIIEDLKSFKVAHLTSWRNHQFKTKFCKEGMRMEKWKLKENISKELIEIVEYEWSKEIENYFYDQSYLRITKKSAPYKLEIFNEIDGSNSSITIDGKRMKIFPDFNLQKRWASVSKHSQKFNKETNERIKQQFFEMISSCE